MKLRHVPDSGNRRTGVPERFGRAWLALAAALTLHVIDEALTGFLAVYNPMALAIRARFPLLRIPTFTFGEWISGLSVGVILLFALSPLAFRGSRWLTFVALPFSCLMAGNALAHIGSSVFLGRMMPGVYSSPMLLIGAVLAFTYARQVRALHAGRD